MLHFSDTYGLELVIRQLTFRLVQGFEQIQWHQKICTSLLNKYYGNGGTLKVKKDALTVLLHLL